MNFTSNFSRVEIQSSKHDSACILSQLATVLLRTLVVFDKSTQIVIVEDKIFVFLGLARKLIQQPSKWPAYDCSKEHASPDEWPAIVAPRDSLSRNEVLRKDFGEDGE
jgi:hypothetical protein